MLPGCLFPSISCKNAIQMQSESSIKEEYVNTVVAFTIKQSGQFKQFILRISNKFFKDQRS